MEAGDVGPVPDRIPTTAVPFTVELLIHQRGILRSTKPLSSPLSSLLQWPRLCPASRKSNLPPTLEAKSKIMEASDVDFQLPGIYHCETVRGTGGHDV